LCGLFDVFGAVECDGEGDGGVDGLTTRGLSTLASSGTAHSIMRTVPPRASVSALLR